MTMKEIGLILLIILHLSQAYVIKNSKRPHLATSRRDLTMMESKKIGFQPKVVLESIGSIATLSILTLPTFTLATEGSDISLSLVGTLRPTIDLLVNGLSFFFICRTILSWYPKTDLTKLPYNIIVWPTEPLLQPVRELIPPAFGVDISSIIWIMLLSFFREILTGQQGILTLIERST